MIDIVAHLLMYPVVLMYLSFSDNCSALMCPNDHDEVVGAVVCVEVYPLHIVHYVDFGWQLATLTNAVFVVMLHLLANPACYLLFLLYFCVSGFASIWSEGDGNPVRFSPEVWSFILIGFIDSTSSILLTGDSAFYTEFGNCFLEVLFCLSRTPEIPFPVRYDHFVPIFVQVVRG